MDRRGVFIAGVLECSLGSRWDIAYKLLFIARDEQAHSPTAFMQKSHTDQGTREAPSAGATLEITPSRPSSPSGIRGDGSSPGDDEMLCVLASGTSVTQDKLMDTVWVPFPSLTARQALLPGG